MKYLSDGHAVEVVAKLPMDRGFVVDPCVEDTETGEPVLLGELMIVDDVYDKPPVEWIDRDIIDRNMKLHQAEENLRLIREELRLAEVERKRIVDKLKQVPALRRIEDFLDGKITHVVSKQYGRVHVMTAEELVDEEDRQYRRKPLRYKLMTLFGEESGNLSFRINQYRDGSGHSDYVAHPCCSEEEARQVAGRLIDEQLQDPRGNYVAESIESADRIGHPVPDSVREALQTKRVEREREAVENARKQLKDAEARLSLLSNPEHAVESKS